MTWEPESWRGDVDEVTPPWSMTDESWRGTRHLEDWPEWDAGPEWQMYQSVPEETEL